MSGNNIRGAFRALSKAKQWLAIVLKIGWRCAKLS